jgi:N-acetylglucosamine kinase-like BadF-type ATPase
VFKAARRGDAVSQEIVDRQADEIVTMAAAAIRKLRLTRLEVEVVLGGGIFHTTDREFFRRIEQGLLEVAPGARMHVLGVPPVVGAALLGLEHLGAGTRALNKARRGLTADRIGTQAGGHAAARR